MTAPSPASNPTQVPHLERQAIRLRRAGRTVFQLALDAQTFGDRIPQSPSTMPSGTQRAFDQRHAAKIYRYILDNPDSWAFNPIIIAANSRDVDWEPIAGTEPDAIIQNGTLRLAAGSMDRMRILDGQHRRAAIQDVLRVTPADTTSPKRPRKLLAAQESLLSSVLSVEMYVIDDDDEVKQIFADMARQRAISAATRAYMDQRDPYNAAAVRLLKRQVGIPWLRRVVPPLESQKQSIRQHSPFWLNAAAVARAVRFRDIGDRRLGTSQRDADEYAPTRIAERVKPFFTAELPNMRPEWKDATSTRFDPAAIVTNREISLAFNTTLFYAVALAVMQWSADKRGDLRPLKERLQALNLSTDRAEVSAEIVPFLRPEFEKAQLSAGYTKALAKMLVESA